MSATTSGRFGWTVATPPIAALLLALTWGSKPGVLLSVVIAAGLIGAVLAGVHHAEVIALKIGEPFGSLLLAVAVTVIEVGLILTLMASGTGETSSLARDTVFAAVMISANGIVGLTLLVGAWKHRTAVYNAEGTGSALATVISLAGLTLVLPTFTTGASGPVFTGSQLAFAAVASLALYLVFVATQTGEHRDFFLPVGRGATARRGDPTAAPDVDGDGHADPPSDREALSSLLLLVVALVSVVGLAKVESYPIEDAVDALGLPHAVVGVVIALLVLLPETIAAVRAALRDRVQISLNLALGSAMASIGLTIPAIAIASVFIDGPLALGLEPVQMLLLALTAVVGTLTVVPGRALPLNGAVHLVLFASFVFLTVSP